MEKWQTIVTIAAILTAIATILKYYNRGYDMIRHQTEQDKRQDEQDKKIEAVKTQHEEDVKAIKTEQTLITYGVLACLKGLREQGCDGAVTDAIDKIDKYLNQAAHGQI